MVSFTYPVYNQIKLLVANLTKKSFNNSVAEIKELERLYGDDTHLFLLRCLLEEISFQEQTAQKDFYKILLLAQHMVVLSQKSGFGSFVARAFPPGVVTKEFLATFSKACKLSLSMQVMVAVGLCRSPDRKHRDIGVAFLRQKMAELADFTDSFPTPMLHELVHFLKNTQLLGANEKQQYLHSLQMSYTAAFQEVSMRPLAQGTQSGRKKVPPDVTSGLVSKITDMCHPCDLIQDLGYAAMQSTHSFQQCLQRFPKLKEDDVAKIIGMMMRTHTGLSSDSNLPLSNVLSMALSGSLANPKANEHKDDAKSGSEWDLNVFVSTMQKAYPNLDWGLVYRRMDFPEFVVPDNKALKLFFRVFSLARPNSPFPVSVILGEWRNKRGQLSLLLPIIVQRAPANDFLSFLHSPRTQKPVPGQFLTLPPQNTKVSEAEYLRFNHLWASIDLIETLLLLAASDLYHSIRRLFTYPMEQCPDLLLMGLASVNSKTAMDTTLKEELLSSLMDRFLRAPSNGPVPVLSALWERSANLVAMHMVRLYMEDRGFLYTILDLAKHLTNGITTLCHARPFSFIIDLAVLASSQNSLFLESWLPLRIAEHGVKFATALLDFIDANAHAVGKPKSDSVVVSVSAQSMEDCLKVLEKERGNLPKELGERIGRARELVQQAASAAPSSDAASATPGDKSKDSQVNAKANRIFQDIYGQNLSLPDAIAMLKEYKNSSDPEKTHIFACMIHNLFDEYRFFHKYPSKELRITGLLFGMLIQHQLVSQFTLGIALRYVLEALRKPVDTKVFKFGMWALEQFRNRLPLWPQYCTLIAQIPHLHADEYRPLMHYLESVLKNSNTAKSGSGASGTPSLSISAPNGKASVSAPATTKHANQHRAGGQLAVGTVSFGPTQQAVESLFPPAPDAESVSEDTADQIHWIVNNVTRTNVNVKARELAALLTPDRHRYFARYLVVTRVATEANNIKLYVTLVDAINNKQLWKVITKTTYVNVKYLLNGDQVILSSNVRGLLKALGTWLGLITLARNKPLLARYLDLKALVLDAFDRDRFIAVIPFVKTILSGSKRSVVFKPPNPWLMALLRLFREIYEIKGLPVNIHFELEMLAKELHIDLAALKPTRLLKDRKVVKKIKRSPARPVSSPSYPQKRAPAASPPTDPAIPQKPIPSVNVPAASSPRAVQIDPRLMLFKFAPDLKLVVGPAVERAINEIIQPVVERSVTIACVTTQELIRKDFAMEPRVENIKSAAHAMVQSLTSSLALVTCKEPLRNALNNHVGSMLESNLPSNALDNPAPAIEEACSKITADNLDACCSFIEKSAGEQAIRHIDQMLAPDYEARAKHAETESARRQQQGYNYKPTVFYASEPTPFLQTLPKRLKPTPGGLSEAHLTVYEDFRAVRHPTEKGGGVSGALQQIMDKVFALLDSLEQAIAAHPNAMTASLTMIPNEHDISKIFGAINTLLTQIPGGPERQKVMSAFAQKIFQRLYGPQGSDNNSLARKHPTLLEETMVALLNLVRLNDPSVVKDITRMVLYFYSAHDRNGNATFDDRRFGLHTRATLKLMKTQALHLPDFDVHLGKAVQLSGRETNTQMKTIEFALLVVRTMVVNGKLAPRSLSNTLQALSDVCALAIQRRNKPLSDPISKLLEDVRAVVSRTSQQAMQPQGDASVPVSSGPPNGVPVTGLHTPVATESKVPPPEMARFDMRTLSSVIEEEKTKLDLEMKREKERDTIEIRQDITQALRRWHQLSSQGMASEADLKSLAVGIARRYYMQEESLRQFFRITTELVVDAAQRGPAAQQQSDVLDYSYLDSLAKLVVYSTKHLEALPTSASQNEPNAITVIHKLNLLKMYLEISSRTLLWESDQRPEHFNQRPWVRLYAFMLHEFNEKDTLMDSHTLHVLALFGQLFHAIRPRRSPPFAFGWLELIAHRMFMPKLLLNKSQQSANCSRVYMGLVVDLLRFLEPYLRVAELKPVIRSLYRGTLRLLLVLLHDFPEFFVTYHHTLCDVVPASCIQMRNLILSAFPSKMQLPDPFLPNLKVDTITDIKTPPPIVAAYTAALSSAVRLNPTNNTYSKVDLQPLLNAYIATRAPSSFQKDIVGLLRLHEKQAIMEAGTSYNVPLINAIVLHIGIQAIANMNESKEKGAQIQFQDSPALDLVAALANDTPAEASYYVLNAIANQLRYPNNHTHFFSCVILYLFKHASTMKVKERVTRVLLERLVVHRPHPWGLLITFIELIRNPIYEFWKQPFTSCAPEIERLFSSVARSCLPPNPQTAQGQQDFEQNLTKDASQQ